MITCWGGLARGHVDHDLELGANSMERIGDGQDLALAELMTDTLGQSSAQGFSHDQTTPVLFHHTQANQ